MAYNNKNTLLKYKDICDTHLYFTQFGLRTFAIYETFIEPYFYVNRATYFKALSTNYKKELEKYDLKDIPDTSIYQLLVKKYPLVKNSNTIKNGI